MFQESVAFGLCELRPQLTQAQAQAARAEKWGGWGRQGIADRARIARVSAWPPALRSRAKPLPIRRLDLAWDGR